VGARRRCCCICWTIADDFDRDDSTDIGAEWDECDGDWEISGNCLQANEKGIALWLRYPNNPPLPPRTGIMTVKIVDPTDGAHYRIYAFAKDGCPEDGTNLLYADLTVAASGGTLVGTVDVGGPDIVSTGAVSTTITTKMTLTFCVGESEIMAYFDSSTYPSRACHDGSVCQEGLYFGLANESDTEIAVFNDAWQIDHYDHDTRCPSCGCDCEGKCMPLQLCLTLTNENYCTPLDGLEFVLESIGACRWISDTWTCGPYAGMYWEFTPVTSWVGVTGECTSYVLTLRNGDGSVRETFSAASNCTCDPLFWEWSEVDFASDSYSSHCCEGYIEDCALGNCDAVIPGPPPPATQYCWCPGTFTITITDCPDDIAEFESGYYRCWEDGQAKYWEA
jgi:hypothetical protein